MNGSYEDWWYNKIIRGYSKARSKRYEHLWLCKTLKQIMFLLDITNDSILIKNSLIILLNLMEDFPLDRYEKFGKDSKHLSQIERNKIKELLKDTLVK